ncbi:MAG: cobalamin-dependent protein [Pseudomonadota bacterium]
MTISRSIKRILLIRPPAHLWPILNESDNFLMPLGFPCLAAYLRERQPELHIRIVDCLPLQLGWKSLEALIAEEKPDLVGVGEMIVYMKEGMRALEIAKRLDREVITVAGGHFHSHMPAYTLDTFPQVDFVVRYEGEETFHQLVRCLNEGGDPAEVLGIAARDAEGTARLAAPRPLLDLDTLPLPAYDLMPVDRYSPFGKLWPRAITIQASRGCPYQCNFCSWSALEGDHKLDEDGRVVTVPRRRQLSVARTLAIIDTLYHQHGVRYLFWTDATWNFDNDWLDELCTALIERRYELGWWAFVRADLMLEQERLGILEKMVRAGLRHCLFGGERPVTEELAEVGKHDMPATALSEACHLLKRKYPQVFRQATFTTGIRSETRESMARLGRFTRASALDFAAFHPLQPYPGTPALGPGQRRGLDRGGGLLQLRHVLPGPAPRGHRPPAGGRVDLADHPAVRDPAAPALRGQPPLPPRDPAAAALVVPLRHRPGDLLRSLPGHAGQEALRGLLGVEQALETALVRQVGPLHAPPPALAARRPLRL